MSIHNERKSKLKYKQKLEEALSIMNNIQMNSKIIPDSTMNNTVACYTVSLLDMEELKRFYMETIKEYHS